MEELDRALVEKYEADDTELHALWQQHQEYEKIIIKLEGKPFLTPQDRQEIKELKKKKLAGKTKLQALLDTYRHEEA